MLLDRSGSSEHHEPVAEFHLLGLVYYDSCQRLQQRIAATLATQETPRMVVLLCEHPALITVGRQGSRQDGRVTQRELDRERLAVRWVKRGGGALVQAPGQLAVYPILYLPSRRWTVGAYLDRLQTTFVEVCRAFGIAAHVDRPGRGVWGRTGLLAAMGVTVQNNTTTQGMFLNVNPAMGWYGFVDTGLAAPGGRATMSCLLAERQRAVRMAEVRSLLMQMMPAVFDCERHYVHSSHVWLETGVACGQVACVR